MHIVINSLRIEEVPFLPYMDRPAAVSYTHLDVYKRQDTTIDHVTDFSQIAAYGVMTTPALVVDGKVVSYGKVLKKDEAKALIQKVRENA